MNRFAAILIISILGLGNSANAQDLTTMDSIAAYTFTHGKTTCTGGNEIKGNGGGGNSQFKISADCDGENGTHGFSVSGPSPLGGTARVTFEGAIFVDAQIGVLDGSGTDSSQTFPYEGAVSPDSYVMFRAKLNKEVTAWCLLTPFPGSGSTAVIDVDMAYSFDQWYSHCEDSNGGIIEGAWNIVFGSVNGTGGKGRSKDRGTFCLSFLQFDLSRGSSDTYEN